MGYSRRLFIDRTLVTELQTELDESESEYMVGRASLSDRGWSV